MKLQKLITNQELTPMKSIIALCIFVMVLVGDCKKLSKNVQLQSLCISPATIFLTKFDIGAEGNFTINYRKLINQVQSKSTTLALGLLQDDNYHKFRQSPTCLQKSSLYTHTQPINFQDKSWGSIYFKIQNQPYQHIWYLYIYDCESEKDKGQLVGGVQLEIIMLNGNSYFGQDQNLLPGYVVLIVVWLVLLVRMFIPIVRSTDEISFSWQQIFIYSGFLLLGVGYIYKFIDLLLVYTQGFDTWYLHYFYKLIKYCVQGVMVTVITSIGWGWFLTHNKQQPYYIIVGTIISIINFLATILETSLNQLEESHHQYESLLGFALFFIRILIFVVFILGIFKCMAESVGKRRHFIKKFGYQGGGYFLAWPFAVIFAELFLPNYMHNEVITLVEQGTHVIISAYMCHLFAYPDTDFKKVRIKVEEEQSLPDYAFSPRK